MTRKLCSSFRGELRVGVGHLFLASGTFPLIRYRQLETSAWSSTVFLNQFDSSSFEKLSEQQTRWQMSLRSFRQLLRHGEWSLNLPLTYEQDQRRPNEGGRGLLSSELP